MGGEADQFHTTRWTLVMASAHDQSQAGRAALAALCQTYWYPLYAFARRRGHSPPEAQDLTLRPILPYGECILKLTIVNMRSNEPDERTAGIQFPIVYKKICVVRVSELTKKVKNSG